ncbi:MAG: hypothetical protein CMF74_06090 [Maricaulis sp.]|jgi:uncharacterized paraquat-inducible protein A|nr:hypothetical protein [Maricaulis sp.]|tara:strand:- start:259 stop:474 length:216 start_codon:yes stop_codon:yes gene_type:complete
MAGTHTTHTNVECEACGTRNSITVNAMNRESEIDCSRCGAKLGDWKTVGPQAGRSNSPDTRIVWNRDREDG